MEQLAMNNVLPNKKEKVKCVVWDLDNTIWDGILLEDPNVTIKPEVMEIIRILDSRGILQSISSKNDFQLAMQKLKEFGIDEYFLYPQINWNPKSSAMEQIAKSINIGIDTLAFIDDQQFELDEVSFRIPQVLCIHTRNLNNLLDRPEMNPRFITEDSKLRRIMYLSDIERNKVEENFSGTQAEFLASLDMRLTIGRVGDEDLKRAEELTVRTHQLNTTGYTYSYEELDEFRRSNQHTLLIVGLEDKYGTYGKIGLVLVECREDTWIIKLLLMSCRVMSRGVGTIIINYIMSLAKQAKVRLLAEYVSNERNRMMYVTYKFAGFKEITESDNQIMFENSLEQIQPFPDYVQINIYE